MKIRSRRLPLPLLACLTLAASTFVSAQSNLPEPQPLWPNGAPLQAGSTPQDIPRITVFIPTRQVTRTGIVVLPGGGYSHLAYEKEGVEFAQWLNGLGIAAFVIQYRYSPYRDPAPKLDAQRGIRWVHAHAAEYNLDPARIGILGFSAGGHLAATVSTQYDEGDPKAADSINREPCRPAFSILAYPVIGPLGRASASSFENLLGATPTPEQVRRYSPDLHVDGKTPPAFLVHASDDTAVDPLNSLHYYTALKAAGVPAEMHIYLQGGHGFGLASTNPALSSWTARLADWLRISGYLNDK